MCRKLLVIGVTMVILCFIAMESATHNSFASSQLNDLFERTTSNGWGTSTSGHAWTVSAGAVTAFSTDNTYGNIAQANTANRGLYVSSLQLTDTTVLARVRFDKTLNTTGTISITIASRIQTPLNTEYRPAVTFRGNNQNAVLGIRKAVNGTQTPLVGDTTAANTAQVANEDYFIKTEVTGSNPTTLRIKVWRASVSEPASWQLTATDSESVLQTSGAVGVMTYSTNLDAGILPIQVKFDSFSTEGSVIQPTAAPTPTPFLYTHLSDTYARTLYDTWGNAETGGEYTTVIGAETYYSTSDGRGHIRIEANDRSRYIAASAFRSTNPIFQAKVRYNTPITGTNAYSSVSFIGRSLDYMRDEYVLSASFTDSSNIVLGLFKRVNGTNTRLATDVTVPIAAARDTDYWFKAEITGSNPTILRTKVWQDGESEPAFWRHTATDSESSLQSSGENAIALYSSGITSSSYPLTWSIDDFTIRSEQTAIPYPSPTPLPGYSVDYSVPLHSAAPLLFGGASSPAVSHIDAWNKLQDAGVTSVRIDLGVNNFFTGLSSFPNGVTLADWQYNVHNIRDESTWNATYLNSLRTKLQLAKDRGMKTIIIINYAPTWLTYSGTIFGVPQDMDIYKDIVKKSFNLVDDLTDYAEIWNEPTLYTDSTVNFEGNGKFLDLRSSPYNPGQARQAYTEIFRYSAAGVHEVNAAIPIIAVAAHNPYSADFLDTLLADNTLNGLVDWVSYHNYTAEEPSYRDRGATAGYQTVLSQHNRNDIKMGVSEWNATSAGDNTSENRHTEKEAISFTGRKLMQFLKSDLYFANYYSLDAYTTKGSHSFYSWSGSEATLLPQARTWRLLSKQLGLGEPGSTIVKTAPDTSLSMSSVPKLTNHAELLGSIDSTNRYTLALTNDSDDALEKTVEINGFPNYQSIRVKLYEASEDNTAESITEEFVIEPNEAKSGVSLGSASSGTGTITFSAPARSVVAATFEITGYPTPTATPGPTSTHTPYSPTPTPSISNISPRTSPRTNERSYTFHCPKGYVYCAHFGPHGTAAKSQDGFIHGTGLSEGVKIFLPHNASPHDIYMKIRPVRIEDLYAESLEIVPFPWSQGLNIAGSIYEIRPLSAFNGYPIVQFDTPGVVIVPYDIDILKKYAVPLSSLRIAVFNQESKRWEVLEDNTVIDLQNNALANISNRYGFFVVVYKSPVYIKGYFKHN